METQILSLEKHQPHIVIPTGAKVHVYPVSYFRNFIAGEIIEEMPVEVLRVIVYDWLNSFPVVPEGG